ncbi:MAG: KOW motif-containing protein [Spiroplasmataceae bacterium]|nr:KOW motif-containing protein [Spiroplasmataceae bacterium]
MNSHNYQWYILSVRGGREEKVIEKINSELKKKGLGNYVKELKVISDSNKKNILKGYILVSCFLNPELTIFFYKVPEIMGFLNHQRGDKNLPISVSQEAIENLLAKTKISEIRNSNLDHKDIKLSVGDLVKITDGAFINREGRITSLDKKKQKVKIIIESSGWEVNDVPMNICEKVIN